MEHYTTIAQSEKLLGLGLSPETADMCHHCYYVGDEEGDHPYYKTGFREEKCKDKDCIPCWSLGALLAILTNDGIFITNKYEYPNGLKWRINFEIIEIDERYTREISHDEYGDTLMEATYKMMIWLLGNNFIEK